jgi:CubicO group peptidase (beta-lactamase class C family)
MAENFKTLFFLIVISLCTQSLIAQDTFQWPQTAAGIVFKDFLEAYNSGSKKEVTKFVDKHYSYTDSEKMNQVVEEWMDLYYRLGPVDVHSISIDKPLDLEVWLQGNVTKTWFAPEFILDTKTSKIKATGLLMGDQPAGVESHSKDESEFLQRINDFLSENEKAGLFQGSVLLQKENKTLLSQAYGFSNIETKTDNTITTRMRISSITKIFTSVACLQLIQQRKLKLNATIDAYLPELPKHISESITLYQLLTHTSNYELDGIDGFREELEETTSMQQVYELHLKYLPKWSKYHDFSVAKKFDYSNDSYDLLAIIIEKVTEQSFSGYLEENIFKPVGMKNTSFENDGLAIPYRYDFSEDKLASHESRYPYKLGKVSGAGGLKSTGEDLLKFHNQLMFANDLLDLPHRSLLQSPLIYKGGGDYHSLGMTISYPGDLNIGHNGTSFANSAEYRYFPDHDFTLIVLCNNRSGAQNFYGFFKNNLPELSK